MVYQLSDVINLENQTEKENYILFLVDGINSDDFDTYIEEGALPNMQKLMKNGSYGKTISYIPSATGPAHIPLFTGKAPAETKILTPYKINLETGETKEYLYDYFGYNLFNNDIEVATIFDYAENAISIGGPTHKGAKFQGNWLPVLSWLGYTWPGMYNTYRKVKNAYKKDYDLIYAWVGGTDAVQHITTNEKKLKKALHQFDNQLGKIMKKIDDNTTIIIFSDHGMEKTGEQLHFIDLEAELKAHKLTQDDYIPLFEGGLSSFYIKKGDNWKERSTFEELTNYGSQKIDLIDMFKNMEGIEFVTAKDNDDVVIFSKTGKAKIEFSDELYRYYVEEGTDPFNYQNQDNTRDLVNQWISKEDSLEKSFTSRYPDAIFQTYSFFTSKESPDIMITAEREYTFTDISKYGKHGGLTDKQMVSPIITSKPILDKKIMRSDALFDLVTHLTLKDK